MPKELVKKESNELVEFDGGVSIEGIDGFNRMDLPMPFMKLVHPLSKNIELATGGKAEDGTWFHTGKRVASKSPRVVMFFAKKSLINDPRHPEIVNDGVKILAVEEGALDSPFAMSFVKGGYWAYKSLMGAMTSWKVRHIWDRYVVLDSKVAQNKNKDEFLVPTMSLSDELSEKDKAVVAKLAEEFGSKIDTIGGEEEDLSVPTNTSKVDVDSIKLEDLDTVKK